MMRIFAFLTILLCVNAENPKTCRRIFKTAELSGIFNETISHALHSMTAQGLELFVDAEAARYNKIPTINRDVTSSIKILPYAPSVPFGNDFETDAMNIMDKILSTLGSNDDGLDPHWTPLERVAHEFHMWDMWKKVRIYV